MRHERDARASEGNVVSRINRFREQLGLATRERYFEEYDNKVNPTLLFKKDGNEYIIQSRNIKPKK
ncbi:hypothetical protein ABW636_20850 [Aquimarina sp. 2201CG1-2-11]|uniref:hypothetical protein n=1 Tax=Aquimarina discodermiae TaxID=3231043 RepID=UPI0034633F6B